MYMPNLKPILLQCDSTNKFKQFWFWMTVSRKWKFTEDYIIHYKKQNKYIYIPTDFIIDGASVPKIFSNIFSPVGILFLGAIPHDFGYKYNGLLIFDIKTKKLCLEHYSKSELDIIFKEINIQYNNLPNITHVPYIALKWFGFIAWNNHRENNNLFSNDFPEYLNDYVVPDNIVSKFC